MVETKKLIDIADVFDSLHQTPEYGETGIPMVRVTDVKPGDLSLEGCQFVTDEVFEKFTASHVPQKGDIVISRVGTYGNFSYVAENLKFCLGQNTSIIVPKINPRYLYYYLRSPFARMQIESRVVGSTQKTLSLKNIKELEILCPDRSIQDKIASFLETIDIKIDNNNKINRNLQEQAEAIYKKLIVDEADDRWTEGSLSDIADIIMGQSPKGDTYNENGEGTVFYQGRGEFGARFPTRRLFTSEPKRMAQTNDVLMSVRAPVGDFNVAYESCCIGRGLAAIRSKDNHQSYILYTTISLQEALNMYNGEGTVFGSINKDSLNGILVNIPPLAVMDEFEKAVKPIDEIIRNSYEEICRLTDLRDAILPRLMSGELDVSDIDI